LAMLEKGASRRTPMFARQEGKGGHTQKKKADLEGRRKNRSVRRERGAGASEKKGPATVTTSLFRGGPKAEEGRPGRLKKWTESQKEKPEKENPRNDHVANEWGVTQRRKKGSDNNPLKEEP